MKEKMTPRSIFKKGSTTYFFSSLFFPKNIQEDVTDLYAFVRTVDDFVDSIPQQEAAFHAFVKETWRAWESKTTHNTIIFDFIQLVHKKKFERVWIEAFLDAMKSDLFFHPYQTFFDLESYMFGSAEVIGLMMARILRLPKKACESARLQGKAMQLINFIRDIKEDLDLGRVYLPKNDLLKFHISLPDTTELDIENWKKLVRFEIDRYFAIQKEAEKGYASIPYRYRIPIATAASMYKWTAHRIYENPDVVLQKKIKPKPIRVIIEAFKQFILQIR